MKIMKTKLMTLIAIMAMVLLMALSLASCASTKPDTDNGSAAEDVAEDGEEAEAEDESQEAGAETPSAPTGDVLKIALGGEPETIDPGLSTTVDGASLIVNMFSGLAKWTVDANGVMKIVPDMAEELVEGELNDDGTITYTYKIREDAVWTDGKPVTAEDFVYAWKRASNSSSGSGFYYLFDVVDGYSELDPDAELNVSVGDEGEFQVSLARECTYWNELLAFPAFFPVREDVVSNPRWAENTSTIVTNGPYKMTTWNHNADIILEKNPDYYDAKSVTQEKIEIYITSSVSEMLEKYNAGELHFIDDVPSNMLENLDKGNVEGFFNKGQLGTYSLVWNIQRDLLGEDFDGSKEDRAKANAEIRNTVNLLIDRNFIASKIGQAGQVPASSFVGMGVQEPDGKEFYANANKGAGNSYYGYFDPSEEAYQANVEKAVETLKEWYEYDEESKTFTNFPELEYIFNTSDGHRAIAEAVQYQLQEAGIHINIKELPWEEFLKARKDGDFDLARNTWIADYNDAISFLNLWTSASGYNDVGFGRGDYIDMAVYDMDISDLDLTEEEEEGEELKVDGGTWAETYDVMIEYASKNIDQKTRYTIMHRAEDLIMSTGCVCPIYFYTDVYMLNNSVKGFYSNPLGLKYFMNVTIEEGGAN